ncbi:unnamed protein product, partial [Prorocentrum cordatum]
MRPPPALCRFLSEPLRRAQCLSATGADMALAVLNRRCPVHARLRPRHQREVGLARTCTDHVGAAPPRIRALLIFYRTFKAAERFSALTPEGLLTVSPEALLTVVVARLANRCLFLERKNLTLSSGSLASRSPTAEAPKELGIARAIEGQMRRTQTALLEQDRIKHDTYAGPVRRGLTTPLLLPLPTADAHAPQAPGDASVRSSAGASHATAARYRCNSDSPALRAGECAHGSGPTWGSIGIRSRSGGRGSPCSSSCRTCTS